MVVSFVATFKIWTFYLKTKITTFKGPTIQQSLPGQLSVLFIPVCYTQCSILRIHCKVLFLKYFEYFFILTKRGPWCEACLKYTNTCPSTTYMFIKSPLTISKFNSNHTKDLYHQELKLSISFSKTFYFKNRSQG